MVMSEVVQDLTGLSLTQTGDMYSTTIFRS